MNSYPKIFNVGHKALDGFFDEEVTVEEKVDGSQFSFWLGDDGEVQFRSKRADIHIDAPGMFEAGVKHVLAIKHKLTPGITYRGEYLMKPKHNVLVYDRVPGGHVILFDLMSDLERYLTRSELEFEAGRLGLEVVKILAFGTVGSPDQVKYLLETESCLGGPTVEGLVFKRRTNPLWGRDGKPLIAKFVSEKFRESHQKRQYKVPKQEVIAGVIEVYRTEARWRKAMQVLRDGGYLEQSPRDIGKLILEVQDDLVDECADEIKDLLFRSFLSQIKRGVIRGIPEWYKGLLLEQQFEDHLEPRQHDSLPPDPADVELDSSGPDVV